MKLDYDLIKEILETVRDNSDGFTDKRLNRKAFEDNDEGKKRFFTVAYHYKIAINSGLIEGEILEELTTSNGNILIGVSIRALTAQGQQALEAMQNDTLWNKIKGNAKQAGIDGVRAIPSLALSMIITGL